MGRVGNSMIKVSIIIPIYNSEPYLEICLNSVVKQTITDIEILLVNDGSTDNSLEICKRFKERDDRIKLYSISNSGSAAARNVGLQNASGEYIGFVDADDWIELDMFQQLYEKAREIGADIVGCSLVRNYNGKEVRQKQHGRSGLYQRKDIVNEIFPGLVCSEILKPTAPVNMVTKIFKRNLIKDYGITFNEKLLGGQDIAFARTCIFHAKCFYLMDEAYLYHYRLNPNSRTHRYMANAWEVYKLANKYLTNQLAECADYDFSDQLRLHGLHGALTSINYEFKRGNPNGPLSRYRMIRGICNDLDGDRVFQLVNKRQLDLKRKIAVFCVEQKWALLLLLFGYFNSLLEYFDAKKLRPSDFKRLGIF